MYTGEILYRFFMFTIATGVSFLILDVRNLGGVVNYYDSMHPVSSVTMQLIATLYISPASELEVRARIMDVGQQSNGSDCGVLTIAFTFDICCGKDPFMLWMI